MSVKVFIQSILIILFFFGDHIPDYKISKTTSIRSSEVVAKNENLTNNFSAISEMKAVDSEFDKFLKKWEIAGATVAIIKDDKLIFAKGYGYADKEKREVVQPYHIFRIASVSKLITAVSVMKLVEEKKLKLSDKVFGKNGILNDPQFLKYVDKRVENITIEHLLRHQGGWIKKYGDQMFMSLYIAEQLKVKAPANLDQIIRFSLSKKLHFEPGGQSNYSNFGYCILGRVIEEITGVSYEEYAVKNILNPLGIFDMKISGTTLDERAENEVKYYEARDAEMIPSCFGTGEYVQRCYGGTEYKTLAASGGWMGSGISMAKFLAAIDGYSGIKDILSKETISTMAYATTTESPMGWRKTSKSGEWWRSGTLAGTAALLKRENNGICYVVITNTGTWKGPKFYKEIEHSMNTIFAKIKIWPQQDLFAVNDQMQKKEKNNFLLSQAKN